MRKIIIIVFVGICAVWAALYFRSEDKTGSQLGEIVGADSRVPNLGGDVVSASSQSSGFSEDSQALSAVDSVNIEQASSAIDSLDEKFLAELTDNPHCADCAQIFAKVREKFAVTSDPAQLKFLAAAMAQSERPELVSDLISKFRTLGEDSQDRQPIIEALELVTGGSDVSKVLAPLAVPGEVEDLRDAAVTGLSGMNDAVAADALVGYARSLGDGKGGYDQGMGLGEYSPNDDAIPLVQSIAADGSKESPLAIRALFNGGVESTKRAVEVLLAKNDEAEQRRLLEGAQPHVLLEPMTTDYIRDLLKSSDKLTPTVRSFFTEALAADVSTGE